MSFSQTRSQIVFSPLIRNYRTYEKISLEIKRSIFKGVLKVGDRLPSENELARQFNVSRRTIREALRLLEISGFITIKRGCVGGPIIEDTILDRITSSILDAILLQKINITDLTIARLEIEEVLLRYVVDTANSITFERLKSNIQQAIKLVNEGVHPFRENINFHRLLAEASNNRIFVIIMEAIMTIIRDFFLTWQPDIDFSKRSIDFHREITLALIKRDLKTAASLMRQHIIEVKKQFEQNLQQKAKGG